MSGRAGQMFSYLKGSLETRLFPERIAGAAGAPDEAAGLRSSFERLAARRSVADEPSVSVVIPIHFSESLEKARRALTSLSESVTSAAVEVILVINGKAPLAELRAAPVSSFVENLGVRVLYKSYLEDSPEDIVRPKNIFIPRQIGFDAARGFIVLQGDIDNKFPPRWIEAYREAFDRDPGLLVAYGPVVYYGAKSAWGDLMALISTLAKATKILLGYPPCAGHNHALRREVGEKIPRLYSDWIVVHENEIPIIIKRVFALPTLEQLVRCVPGAVAATAFAKKNQSLRGLLRWTVQATGRNIRQIRRLWQY